MSKYTHIDNLMEFWNCDFVEALKKSIELIEADREYYLNAFDPFQAIAKKVILNKRYTYKKVNPKDFVESNSMYSHVVIPVISIVGNDKTNAFVRFSVGFYRSWKAKLFPEYVKIEYDYPLIRLTFSYDKIKGYMKITKPNSNSQFRQAGLRGFLNRYELEISHVSGYYHGDKAFKQHTTNNLIYYLYVTERENLTF